MNRKLSRLKGLYLSCVSIVLVVTLVCSLSFESYASDEILSSEHTFFLNYAQPAVGDNSGYINILVDSGSGYYVSTFFWTLHGYVASGLETPMAATWTINPHGLTFGGFGDTSSIENFFYSLYLFDAAGNCKIIKSSSSDGWTFSTTETIVAWKAYGNVDVSGTVGSYTPFTVYYSQDGTATLLLDVLMWLQELDSSHSDIITSVQGIFNSVNGVESQLDSIFNYLVTINITNQKIGQHIFELKNKMADVLNKQDESNTWLEKIWNSIQEFFNPDEAEQEESDKFKEESSQKAEELDNLNEQNQVDKPSVDDTSNAVDDNVDFDSLADTGTVLASVTENEYVIQMLLLVFTVALVGYVLFGKK